MDSHCEMQSPASLCIHGADFPVISFLRACVFMDVPFTRSKKSLLKLSFAQKRSISQHICDLLQFIARPR
jgi:hypothetical protein